MTKPLSPTLHSALDYGIGATLLTAPHLLGLSRGAKAFFGGFGAVATVVNALTDSPLGVRRVIPWRTHRVIDLASDPLYLALPLVTGIAKDPRARALWLATSAALAAAVVLTDWDAAEQ
ncbi:hypothetical protein [Cellulomonas hominis]|uniref:hypothetical protein n=1 Tax=Cellulomonas hominis TaxID=156981 RepID=UPI001BA25200|nr:hypothetical protein [Cellulomonas hominis]VTR75830.1 hypothetical protein CHMI_00583 [Cellulomonas hominis]